MDSTRWRSAAAVALIALGLGLTGCQDAPRGRRDEAEDLFRTRERELREMETTRPPAAPARQ